LSTTSASIVLHLLLLLAIVSIAPPPLRVAPFRLPGTSKGVATLTYYSPGSLRPATASAVPLKKVQTVTSPTTFRHAPATPKPEKLHEAKSDPGVGISAQSGLGEGDITIALATYFPHPTPDLSVLPHGTEGDVILNALIDEHGKIAKLELLKGLGPAIDQIVIATVQQWSYTPAKKDGVPVPSEQELHFHYQRS
jgi:protein TonB